MFSKNDEAPTALTVEASNLPVNLQEKTNMNMVTKAEFNFHGVNLTPVNQVHGVWLTSADVAKALGYKSTKSISNLFAQYEDEFSQGMTMVIESMTNGINGSSRKMKVRVFSLRGAHLIAMFARTPVAKEFRRWVLDILEREVVQGNVNPAFDFEMHARNAQTSLSHITYIHQEWCSKLRPALRALGSPLAIDLEDRIKAVGAIAFGLDRALSKQNKKGMIH